MPEQNPSSIWQRLLASNRKMPAGIVLVIVALIMTTPLCNQIFSCGCTWPWQGLDHYCNFHVQQAPNKCPWCVSWLAAGLSLGPALVLAYGLCMRDGFFARLRHLNAKLQILIRFSLALSVYTGIAYLGGLMSALWLAYPVN